MESRPSEDMSVPCDEDTGLSQSHGPRPHHSHNPQRHHPPVAHALAPRDSQRLPPPDSFLVGASSSTPGHRLHLHYPPSPPRAAAAPALLRPPPPMAALSEPQLKTIPPLPSLSPPTLAGLQASSPQRGPDAWKPAPTVAAGPDGSPPPQFARGTSFPPRPQGADSYRDGPRLSGHRSIQPPPLSTPRARQVAAAADGTSAPTMPNLLAPGRTQALGDMRFSLRMRQQPRAARACGFGDRDRRVIDPPPIVQLVIESGSMTEDEVQSYLRCESYVMNCAICDETGTRDASFMPDDYQHQRRLMGSLVGTPFVGRDDKGVEGCFFCFGDLSCRTPGAFRLKFTLIMIDPMRAGIIRHFPILTEALSDVFYVYSAKEFPGMLPSSNLAKRLKEQGCIISIKKGNDRSRGSRQPRDDASDNEDADVGQSPRRRRLARD
ncbi:hypothetical protein XA68_16568 [Ophiocordyceps unilateralis]|uniref:Velvet domain-containing protein n=1 Tax=Ophiocordyceps unilateralis TaxID=268505 RepID=A0A2A9PJL2_OPHUN|nr:hypothetical protein XA68_16568 [Ophiocordyceps unilateralis]